MNNKLATKIVLGVIIAAAIALFWVFDLGRYLSLSYIKEAQGQLAAIYSERPLLVIAIFASLYISVTSLSLPGAAIMTLAGGALFGLGLGTLVASFASTIGATLACIVSRFLLRDWVQGKFGDKLVSINRGIEQEGSFYLFTLRLIPVFPFFVINLVMGLTKMPIIRFSWVSQLGMLPGTIVFVNAGRELAKIESLAGILSPGLILSFALLGLFPIAAKKGLAFYTARRSKRNVAS